MSLKDDKDYSGMSIIDIARMEFEAREAEAKAEKEAADQKARAKAAAHEKAKKAEKEAEKVLNTAKIILGVVIILLLCTSQWMGENWFAYQRTYWETVETPYEYVVDRINTYVAYTTTYGECYHDGTCGYLHSSSHKTTVYEAQQDGYRKCSRCTPRKRAVLEITETRYMSEQLLIEETVETTEIVFFSGTGLACLIYFCGTQAARKRRDIAWAEYRRLE